MCVSYHILLSWAITFCVFGNWGFVLLKNSRDCGEFHFCRDFAMFCEDICRAARAPLHPRLFRPRPEVDASRSESALPVAVEEMGPLLLRAAHVLPEQQRPLRRLLHCAASICPQRLFMSPRLGQRASRPLRHTTGTTGVPPVDILGQRASRPLKWKTPHLPPTGRMPPLLGHPLCGQPSAGGYVVPVVGT